MGDGLDQNRLKASHATHTRSECPLLDSIVSAHIIISNNVTRITLYKYAHLSNAGVCPGAGALIAAVEGFFSATRSVSVFPTIHFQTM